MDPGVLSDLLPPGRCLSLAVLFLAPFPLRGQEPVPTPAPPPSTAPSPSVPSFSVHGLVDVYYAWNAKRPSDHAHLLPRTGTTAKRGNEFALNLAALDLTLDAKPVGFKLIAVAGNG